MPRVLNYELKDFGGIKNLNNQINGLVTENALLKDQIPNGTVEGTTVQITDSSNLPIEDGVIKGNTSQGLPDGYQQVDYIESTGTQYIDTNYTPVQGDSFEFKNVSFTPNSNMQTLFSAGTGDYQLIFLVAIDHIYFKYFSTGSATALPLSSFNNANIKINNNGEVYINDVLKATANYDGAVNTSLNLFCRVNNADYMNAKIGEIIISNNNIIKKHYIPAQRNSDNAVGLYEIVGNTFYNNGGTGTFSKGNEVPNPDYKQDIHTVTGNCNTNFSDENGEAEQNTPLTLGNIELCKIGDYQDYLFKNTRTLRSGRANPLFNPDLDEGAWYKHKVINKVVFDGSENWMLTTEKIITQVFLLGGVMKNASSVGDCLSNYFKNKVPDDAEKIAIGTGNLYIAINKTTASTVEELKTWLSTHNTTVYYILATATDIEITDTTLIAQLEAYYNSSTYRNVTNIITAGEDLAPIASIVYKKDLTTLFNHLDSLEARVDLLEE